LSDHVVGVDHIEHAEASRYTAGETLRAMREPLHKSLSASGNEV